MTSTETHRARTRRPRIRIGAVLALAAVVAFGVWLGVGHKRGGKSTTTTTTQQQSVGATAVSAQGLRTIANALGQPIYWAGPKHGVHYELTQTPDGRIYVRYLPKRVDAGSPNPYLTVSTYPVANAFAATNGVAKRSTAVRINVGSGAVAFYGTTRPTNVYEAFQGSNYQIEVYSPSAKRAQQLVTQKRIRPVAPGSATTTTSTPPTGAVAATPNNIKQVASGLGRPVYWAGSEPHVTYELTQTPDGRVYVRYLPAGVKVGSNKPYLTVATYPLQGAYATTSAAAAQQNTVKITVNGGVAYYSKTRPTSVYVAFRGTDEQIEVFDPSAARLHKLVASGKVKPAS
jgi:hypothetical protein